MNKETGRFEKGDIPPNKGFKRKEWMSPESEAICKKTQFKKGHVPKNKKPIGSERISVDGYIEVKVSEKGRWALKHRIVYEQAHGKIPKGYVVVFADGNKLNLELDNLILVSRNELCRMNQNKLFTNDKELTKSGLVLVKLMNKMYENGQAEIRRKQYQKKYAKENREKINEYQRKYQKRKRCEKWIDQNEENMKNKGTVSIR